MKIGPVCISKPGWWYYMWNRRDYYGLFRNSPNVQRGRWGFYVLGFEFGNRNPGGWFGLLLYRLGLWPW